MPNSTVPCECCGGTGKVQDGKVLNIIYHKPCSTCHGSGFRPITVEDLREAWKLCCKEHDRDFEESERDIMNLRLHQRYGIKEEK